MRHDTPAPPKPPPRPRTAETIATVQLADGATMVLGARYGPGDRAARWRTPCGSLVASTVADPDDRRVAVLALARALGPRWRVVAVDEESEALMRDG